MKLTALIVVPAILFLCLAAAGCRDDGAPTPTSTDGPGISDVEEAAGEADVVKTMDEYRAEAEAEIDAPDAEAELRKLEAEIEADIAAEE